MSQSEADCNFARFLLKIVTEETNEKLGHLSLPFERGAGNALGLAVELALPQRLMIAVGRRLGAVQQLLLDDEVEVRRVGRVREDGRRRDRREVGHARRVA